ncbi:MAG: antitoxin [Candidatus Dormiibacterota bacterium]
MRTTVDLPDDLHGAARARARDLGQSLSKTLVELVRNGLEPCEDGGRVSVDAVTGLPLVRLGKPVTVDMVREVDDE